MCLNKIRGEMRDIDEELKLRFYIVLFDIIPVFPALQDKKQFIS